MTALSLSARLTALANPKRFLDISTVLLPWTAGASVLLLAAGFYMALFATPPDYQQGETVKIMFVHVPAAWMGMFVYAVMAGASFTGLVFKHPLADMSAKAAAPLGAAFTALALFTGALWGKPMWGTYWVWDARLTSELILLFIYLGYIALWDSIEDPVRAAKATAVLALVGAVNLPIIHFSVDWWNTLHQPASLLREGGPAIHPAFLWPLLTMAVGYNVLFVWLWLLRVRTEIFRRRARSLMLAQGAGQ
jgi:heme exporter protein C